MSAIAKQPAQLRPFTVIGYSTNDEVLCPSCLRETTPLTGEKLEHICRKGPRSVPDSLRKAILAHDAKHMRPTKIATTLKTTLPTVMRVISGDADDAPSCPACEASKRTENREIVPLFFGDSSVSDESCTYCHHGLRDMALRHAAERTPTFEVAHTTVGDGYPALNFDRRPPENILQALKAAGWKWRPSERVWVDFSRTAEVPEALRPPPKPAPVKAKAPIIRRKAAMPAPEATVH